MDPTNKLTAKRYKKLSGQALADELQKRRSKRCRALQRRWTPRLSLRQEITWRRFPSREEHEAPFAFDLFAQPPTELRIKIWKLGFRGRTIEICVDFDHLGGYDEEVRVDVPQRPDRIVACHTITQNPITLFTPLLFNPSVRDT
ncbi:hypothetical protein BOTCAL_0066g00270 [Botryotinia calthae]|uniref:Uncharacterized protein n=1 Tax=Botryotinia calthae TaxID=38488 RepID=A0A4Y8DBU0_9HELO|nr:hypothetical protein BOTCAL_0066g00270 [Botryotinia calthae]